MSGIIHIPGMGKFNKAYGMELLDECSDGIHKAGCNGVVSIVSTGDKKVEFICFEEKALAYVKSELGFPAYYPVYSIETLGPIEAVMMDLDGTSVTSEEFWINIIEKTVRSLLKNDGFSLEDADIPFVSGHSVSEHLMYCISKYCPEKTLAEARDFYFSHTSENMQKIMMGKERKTGFVPQKGLKDFLFFLKERGIKIALVTSGLYSKAFPEIVSAFQQLGLDNPVDFYDCIITAGERLKKGNCGTMGELEAKPHPWLYTEAYNVGLNIPFSRRSRVIGIEDSGAGVCAVRLSNVYTIGMSGGNIMSSGTRNVCNQICDSFEEIEQLIKMRNG